MGVIFCIRIGMMHAVHGAIAKRAQVIGALEYPSEDKEHLFSKRAHRKCLVGSVAVQEKSLKEQGQVPMGYEKDQNCFHVD